MKFVTHRFLAASALFFAIPVTTFAQQSAAPITRAQVRAELVELERAGYQPSVSDVDYPKNLLAAEARVLEQQAKDPAFNSGFGSSTSGSTGAGESKPIPGLRSAYFGQ